MPKESSSTVPRQSTIATFGLLRCGTSPAKEGASSCRPASICPAAPARRTDSGQSPLIRGGSCIVTPLGKWLAGPAYGSEQILTAEINLAEIAEGKFDLDVVGHYARADVFQLQVNESPQEAVSRRPPVED